MGEADGSVGRKIGRDQDARRRGGREEKALRFGDGFVVGSRMAHEVFDVVVDEQSLVRERLEPG
jgi:hypothetical protein